MKRFLFWCTKKEQLHKRSHVPPLVNQRDIWWASVGENIGSEINGKSGEFSRPVVILKKFSHGFYFVVPTTTQTKTGTWFAPFTYSGKNMYACLHQVRAIDHRRLSNRIGQLDDKDFQTIKDGLDGLLK